MKDILWTKHALKSASEDRFATTDVEKNLNNIVHLYSENGKKKGVIKVGERYCTIIYCKGSGKLKIITCWKSSWWEVKAYERER